MKRNENIEMWFAVSFSMELANWENVEMMWFVIVERKL